MSSFSKNIISFIACFSNPCCDFFVTLRNVQSMEEIKTPNGYARAWIRLALEKKLLSRHFRELLSNQDLLR